MAMIAAELLAAGGGTAAAGVVASEAATGAAAVEAGSFASRSGAFLGRNATKLAMSKPAQTVDQNYQQDGDHGKWGRQEDKGSGAGAGGSATAPVASSTTEKSVDYSGT